MANLLSLPDELLLRIACHLRYSPRFPVIDLSYTSLRQLSLTCQRLRPIAQEYLFLDIILERRATYEPPPNGLHIMVLLLRSLLERRDLAKKVETLAIIPMTEPYNGVEECIKSGGLHGPHGKTCGCGWTQIAQLTVDFLQSVSSLGDFQFDSSSWYEFLGRGYEDAHLGLILLCAPAVRSLTVDLWRNDAISPIYPEKLFGSLAFTKGFSSWLHSCLANVTKLSSRGIISPEFMGLPKLELLELGLQNDRFCYPVYEVALWHYPLDFQLSSTVKRLRVFMNLNALYGHAILPSYNILDHFKIMVNAMPNLTHLFLDIIKSRNLDEEEEEEGGGNVVQAGGNYTHIASLIDSVSLQCLIIDISGVAFDPIKGSDDVHLLKFEPIKSLLHLPRLRQLMAPQAAIFSVGSSFKPCLLPDAIEHIGIIDSTKAANRYAQFLLQNRLRWQKLGVISLWLDNWTTHHDIDPVLFFYLLNIELSGGEKDQVQTFEIENDIWDDVKAAGIRVTKHTGFRAWVDGWDVTK